MRAEVLVGPERRRRWSAEEKTRIAAQTRGGGRTVADAARQYGVSRSLIYTWRRAWERGLANDEAAALPSLVPVVVDGAGPTPVAVPAKGDGAIEIGLPGDVRITLRGRIEERTLRAVLSLLRSA